jgi:hypothetical protein
MVARTDRATGEALPVPGRKYGRMTMRKITKATAGIDGLTFKDIEKAGLFT